MRIQLTYPGGNKSKALDNHLQKKGHLVNCYGFKTARLTSQVSDLRIFSFVWFSDLSREKFYFIFVIEGERHRELRLRKCGGVIGEACLNFSPSCPRWLRAWSKGAFIRLTAEQWSSPQFHIIHCWSTLIESSRASVLLLALFCITGGMKSSTQ